MFPKQLRSIDLTQEYANDMWIYPGAPRPIFRDIATVEREGFGMSEWLFLSNHCGTHIDAPSHIVRGATLDEVPLEHLIGEAVVLDFSHHPRGAIHRAALEPYLDRIQPGDRVLIASGGSRYWNTEQYRSGWCYLAEDAARALIERQIRVIGFDGPSADAIADPVETTTYDLHALWLSAGCLILENLTNLDQLPERVFLVIAPLKVRQANGGPARVFALIV